MKILYLSTVPSPFQYEFVLFIQKKLSATDSVKLVYTQTLTNDRKHWGENDDSFSIKAESISDLKTILNNELPDIIVLTQYRSKQSFYVKRWCKINSKQYFIGPIEKLLPKNILITQVKKMIFKIISSNAIGIAAIGNSAVQQYQKMFSGVVVNIPYSFSLNNILERKRDYSNLQEEIKFLYSGRLEEFRNPLSVIYALQAIIKIFPEKKIRLIISGSGSLENKCKNLIKTLDLECYVQWITKFKDWYEIHNIYFEADILLAPQKYSGWGLIIQEAMAAGMGIIAGNNMVASEDLIIHDYNGFKISVNDNTELITHMRFYIENFKDIEIHGNRSRDIVKSIDVDKTSERFLQIINTLKNDSKT